jgi:acetyl esterase/lipase
MNVLVSLGVALLALSTPGAAHVERNVVYAPGHRGGLDVYAPWRLRPHAPIAVFIYGGSWDSGDKATYRFVGKALASRGIVTVIPDYRVYPEARFPDFLEDNAKAVAFAKKHATEWGADPARLYLVGHSAGAYNAAMLALDRHWLAAVGLDARTDLKGVVGLAGPYDFLPLRSSRLKMIFGPPDRLAETQPITHVDGASPPMSLLAGEKDTVVDPGNTMRLAAAIRASGGDVSTHYYPGLGHIGILTSIAGLFRYRAPVLRDIATFIDAQPMPVKQSATPALGVRPLAAGA